MDAPLNYSEQSTVEQLEITFIRDFEALFEMIKAHCSQKDATVKSVCGKLLETHTKPFFKK